MPDDLERQLEAFGATLETQTGEPIASGSPVAAKVRRRPTRRWWAIAGAAASVVAVVVGLVVVNGRKAEAPAAQQPAPPSTTTTLPVAAIQTTTIPTTIPELAAVDPIGDDPLGLERDGWTLVQRNTDPFSMSSDEIPCDVADVLAQINGVDQVHDILTPPTGTGLDLDIQILDVGSHERGLVLADFVESIGQCLSETEGVEVETGAMSSVRATWFRAGPDFALVAIVGEGPRSIVMEIEGALFDDDLIGELAHRADQFLRGEPVTPVNVTDGAIAATALAGSGDPQAEPEAGQVKLWVSNQSFEDDPVAITVEIDGVQVVDGSFEVGGQHNWFSFMIDGLEPGEHTLIATSDTGATFAATFTLPPGEPLWMVVDYWYYPDDAEGRLFTFDESDEPIYFS